MQKGETMSASKKEKRKRIYADNASTTKIKPEVLKALIPYLSENFGNPSTIYKEGQIAKRAIENARETIALAIGATSKEIFFTGSGTESDNWAIKGSVKNEDHIITSKIEHHAVLESCIDCEKNGCKVSYLSVDKDGIVCLEELKNAITPKTKLVSVMLANNEIGTIQPIREIAEIIKNKVLNKRIFFHTDAVAAFSDMKIDVNELGVDLLSLSGHKIGAPKGIGALYIKNGVKISNFMNGGMQERGKRAGTENVTGIVGFAKATELLISNFNEKNQKLKNLREELINGICSNIKNVKINGHPTLRLSGNVNISVNFVEGESLLLMLNEKGIAASSGSACTSGALDPSHVLLAIGLPHEIAHGSLRFTLNEDNDIEDVKYITKSLIEIVAKLRKWSPLS